MVLTRHVAKRQRVEECTSCMESVLFNSDSLFKIASYLPADGLINLALTCTRFGVGGGDSSLSLVEETARRIVHDVATEEEMATFPNYDEDNWLSKYNYLQSLRAPLTFDQLLGQQIEYVDGNKSRVAYDNNSYMMAIAFSNNIMMAGKHYVSFEVYRENGRPNLLVGVMRPGEAGQSASYNPLLRSFFNHFTQREGSLQYNNNINCCIYDTFDGCCFSHDWDHNSVPSSQNWDGHENLSFPCKIGMLLDLDEGTLSVYKNGRKLGVMKRGLSGHYCWVVVLVQPGSQVTIKREQLPES